MPAIPLPFVTALLLVVLLARMAGQGARAPLTLFVALCAVQAVVLGLRWNYDWPVAHLVQPVLAAALPPLAWLGFAELRRPDVWRWPHAIPVVVVAALVAAWSEPIDLVLIIAFCGYGVALLWAARQGPDGLRSARFGDAAAASHAMMAVGALFIFGALVEVAIALDSDAGAAHIVGFANVVLLVVIGYAAAVAGRSSVPAEPDTTGQDLPRRTADGAPEDDAQLLAAIDRLMRERKLYRDPNLTLDRLSRRAGIPARHISAAVNRAHGRNVSQVVNEYRVEEARRLLAETAAPVTEIMFEAGFQTKSNFNREFLRVTGQNPSDYRRSLRQGQTNGH